ncbi:MAG: hypothetical protein QOC78_281 [Solirubrobacteraceae bacterium]|jgi:hypothetical protein|nr:hypothetical protein [Solirubrobacteraceae bacterium]
MPEDQGPINEDSEGQAQDAASPPTARAPSDANNGLLGGGVWRGRVRIAADFDELPEDIADAFGAR